MTSTFRFDSDVQKVRAWTGLLVVVFGDLAIAAAAIFGIVITDGGDSSQVVAILTSAFTALGTMTTAYFGIRGMSNTAESSIADARGPQGEAPPPPPPEERPETRTRGAATGVEMTGARRAPRIDRVSADVHSRRLR